MVKPLKTALWRCLAVVALALGLIGAFLPVMPTVPFVLLSAWAASKGWPRLEAWLLDHPLFGKSIREWRERGAVSRRAKYFAGGGMLLSAILLQFIPLPNWGLWVRWVTPLIFVCVCVWLWRRPEH
jgi:uncharacterized protein